VINSHILHHIISNDHHCFSHYFNGIFILGSFNNLLAFDPQYIYPFLVISYSNLYFTTYFLIYLNLIIILIFKFLDEIYARYSSYYCQSYYLNSIFLESNFRICLYFPLTSLFISTAVYYLNYLSGNYCFS